MSDDTISADPPDQALRAPGALAGVMAGIGAHRPLLRQDLQRWSVTARRAGFYDESIEALCRDTFRSALERDVT